MAAKRVEKLGSIKEEMEVLVEESARKQSEHGDHSRLSQYRVGVNQVSGSSP